MASPFYVQPGNDFGQGLQGLAQQVNLFGQQKRQDEEKAKVEQRFKEAQTAMSEAFASGDSNKIMEAAIKYPEIQKTAELMFGFTNERSKAASADTYRRVLSDPQNAIEYMDSGIQQVADAGGKPYNMIMDRVMMQRDPDAALKSIKAGFAAIAPEEYKAMFPQSVDEAKVGRFRTITLPDGGVATLDTATNQVTPIASAPAVDLSILPEDMRDSVAKQPVEVQRKIVEQFSTPGSVAAARESEKKMSKAAEAADKTKNLVDELLANESGIRAVLGGVDERLPTVFGSTKDAEAGLEDLRNLLTVDNLGLMSGVLSESDMKVLRSVGASGLTGSQDRVLQTLKKMQKALSNRNQAQEKTEVDDLVNKYAD